MTIENDIYHHFDEHLKLVHLVRRDLSSPISMMGSALAQALTNGGTLFWCGNGGSAADSQHLAAEMVGRFKGDRRALRSVALTTDSSVLTCIANDYGYDVAFARQVEALGRPGDVLIGISTSGRSRNVLNALHTARGMGLKTMVLLGRDGGAAKDMADHTLIVPSESTARIQEVHILIGHIWCEIIERELGLA